MCGRYTLSGIEALRREFAVVPPPGLAPRYNIAPSQQVVVVHAAPGGRAAALCQWGLVPPWSRDGTAGGYSLINARAETVAEKPAFRAAFRRHRCLIPADGFYEWQRGPAGRQPYHLRRPDRGVFAFAGLWSTWLGPLGARVQSCAIIVTAANARVAPIHDRMPVILAPADYAQWLAADTPIEALSRLLAPCPDDWLEAVPVSRRVNAPGEDDARLIERHHPPASGRLI